MTIKALMELGGFGGHRDGGILPGPIMDRFHHGSENGNGHHHHHHSGSHGFFFFSIYYSLY